MESTQLPQLYSLALELKVQETNREVSTVSGIHCSIQKPEVRNDCFSSKVTGLYNLFVGPLDKEIQSCPWHQEELRIREASGNFKITNDVCFDLAECVRFCGTIRASSKPCINDKNMSTTCYGTCPCHSITLNLIMFPFLTLTV